MEKEIIGLEGLKGLEDYLKKIKEDFKIEQEKYTKPAKKIIKILSGFESFERNRIAEEIGKLLYKLDYKDRSRTLHNVVADRIIDGLVGAYQDTILMQVNYIRDNQEKIEDSYGDIDSSFKKILLSDNLDVFTMKDHCTCSDEDYWLIVNDKSKKKLHVRLIYEKGDYPKADFPKKLNLKFYKDRNWRIEYVEEFHMTKLGGVYGDVRDDGYIISFTYDEWYSHISSIDHDNIYYINSQRHFAFNLNNIYIECKMRKENK